MIRTEKNDFNNFSPRTLANVSLLKFKIKKDGPYEFVLEEINDKIIIARIFEGGIIYKHGGAKVGDELFDVNGIKLKGKSISKCVEILEAEIVDQNKNYIEFTVYRDSNNLFKEMQEKRNQDIDEEIEEEVTSL